eukprot:CAMPEP_0181336852 /NCGR_PEP_ID=MMETSP1101-20121128/27667_1 /TAXON_ID=46948 /ORGANISM="Rhodomonas abbreviata, Strain Caron Lab Isolate" /LENGTH=428 /DNA_ID=CAMNT_0023447229 /DNA_START=9 /DNA_END=1296 /DNA_ORIENTATION=-
MSTPSKVDPEDYNLNSGALDRQNESVLSAQERARRDQEDEEALERIAQAYRGKPVPEDWDPNSHPYFMTDIDAEIAKGNPFVEGFQQLLYEDPPEVIAENKKTQGNDALKRGPKYYDDAIKLYTSAIDAGSSDAKANAVYYSNRAAVQLLKRNYGKVVEDTDAALKLDPANVKSYFRAGKALAALYKWQLAIQKFEDGLKVDPENKDMKKLLEETKKKHAAQQQEVKKKEMEKAKSLVADSSKTRAARKAIEERGVTLGEAVGGQNVDASVDDNGHIHWPVLVVYDEFDQSDFVQDVHEGTTVEEIMQMIFDPSQPPPDWDVERRYKVESVRVYYATHQCKELATGKKKVKSDEDFIGSLLAGSDRKDAADDYARASKSQYVVARNTKALCEVLVEEGHVVPGFPVLHVVCKDSVFERHFLEKGPAET